MTPPPPRPVTSTTAKKLADKVRALVASGGVTPFSAVDIVRAAVELGAGWDVVEDVVGEIAKGEDGIGGTADDLIPAATLETLQALLRGGAVRDMVAWVTDAGMDVVAGSGGWCPCFGR